MSYSVSYVGKAEAVVSKLESYSETLSGQIKEEYDNAKPHIIGIVKQNFAAEGDPSAVVKVSVYGSANTNDGKIVSSSCAVTVERIHGFCE